MKQKTVLEKTKTKICLPAKGIYKLTPVSCHKFKEASYIYNTDKSTRLELVPTEFLANGLIEIDSSAMEKIKSMNLTSLSVDVLVEEQINKQSVPYKTIPINLSEKEKSKSFNFYTKPSTSLLIKPVIPSGLAAKEGYKNLIFLPKEKHIDVKQNCLLDAAELSFTLKYGLIIEGKIAPAMEGVIVSSYNKVSRELIASATTEKTGSYKIGPLYTEFEYDTIAIKEGYKIVPEAKNPYNFNAEKLSFLRVKVVDTNGKPLSSVFLSLSSADRGFKINNSTNADGYMDFLELYSGEYYIKPLFKEYKFEPSQKLVNIKGGQHYEETIVGVRIAFSIYGKINNLNKERVEGLYIQAYDEKTKQIQETTIDKNGEYRLKGLNPGHNYVIKVKIPINSCMFIYINIQLLKRHFQQVFLLL